MRSRALSLGLGLGLALGLLVAPAAADPAPPGAAADRARAREAYDRGAAAHQRGDEATAARELALADAILPNPVTLQAALEAALAADDGALAITLCERAQRAPLDGPLAELVQRARARFAPAPLAPLDREPPPPRVAPPPERTSSPGWFLAALGSTVVAAGVTVGLALDTASKHGGFVSAGCPGPVHGDCAALASDGLAAQLGTNAMIGVTAALGAATVVAGVLTFRARDAAGAERAALSFGAGPTALLRVPLP